MSGSFDSELTIAHWAVFGPDLRSDAGRGLSNGDGVEFRFLFRKIARKTHNG
jgi:hypothetical protein